MTRTDTASMQSKQFPNFAKRYSQKNVMIYYDLDNIPYHTCIEGLAIITERSDIRILSQKVFGDMDQIEEQITHKIQQSHKLILCPKPLSQKDNCTDINLVVEVMADLYTNPAIDIFIISSCDSDYIPLCKKIQELGKDCWLIISSKKRTSKSVYEIFDYVIDIGEKRKKEEDDDSEKEKEKEKAQKEKQVRSLATILQEILDEYATSTQFRTDDKRINKNRILEKLRDLKIDFSKYDKSFTKFLETYVNKEKYSLIRDWIVPKDLVITV